MLKRLVDIREEDKEYVGVKAYNCAFMLQHGINVPDGFILYDKITEEDFQRAEKYMIDNGYFVVRSTMGGEDQNNASGAGKYLSLMNITAANLREAVEEIYEQAGKTEKKAVLIQHFIESEVAGVVFTVNPIGGKGMLINSALGIGENVVAGCVTPDEYEVIGDNINVIVNQKNIVYTYGDEQKPGKDILLNGCRCRVVIENDRKKLLSVHFADRYKPSLTDGQVLQIKENAEKIRELFGEEQDIEFGFYDSNLFIMQARPITALIPDNKHKKRSLEMVENNKIIVGQKVSMGAFRGKVVKVEYGSPLGNVERFKDSVLVIDEFFPQIIYDIDGIGAVVTSKGGILSHAAILCREYKIPCVIGIKDQIHCISDGDELFVDADNGEVILYV